MKNFCQSLRGSLLMELLAVMVLVSLFLPFLVNSLSRLQERHLLAQTYQDQHTIKAAIESHFKAQWRRLVPANCRDDSGLFLTIQNSESKPDRLSSRTLIDHSDWLRGDDYGACRTFVTVSENPFETPLDCHWKAGDNMMFSHCAAYVIGQLLSVTSKKSIIEFDDNIILGQSGIIESQDGFYWYLSPGKDGSSAFWRTPEESGNALELWSGVERLAIFPLLDDNNNGSVDTLDAHYGDFSLKRVRGLWVEYQYRLANCKSIHDTQQEQDYLSLRGDTWHYASPCQGVGNQIIVLKGS